MKVRCKKNINYFKKNEYYVINNIHSIFESNDFITIQYNNSLMRFRLNKSNEYIDDYIGVNEIYFYNYFFSLKEDRKNKLKYLFEL